MKKGFNTVYVFIAVAFLILVASTVFVTYFQSEVLKNNITDTEKHRKVLASTNQLLANITTFESSIRLFQLTKSKLYIESIQNEKQSIQKELRQLQQLLQVVPNNEKLFDSLNKLTAKQIQLYNQFSPNNFQQNVQIVAANTFDESVALNKTILNLIQQLKAEQDGILSAKKERNIHEIVQLQYSFLIVLTLLFISFYLLAKRLIKLIKKENLLYEELQQQSDLINNSNDAIITIDDQFKITSWNYGAEKSLGYKRSEVINKSILKVLKSDLTEERRSENIASLKEKGTWKGEVVQYNRDGEKLYMLLSYSAVKNADGSIKGYTSIRTDITAQKLLESKLKFENSYLEIDVDKKAKEIKEIFERMKKAFIAFDRNLNITYANDTIATYMQKDKDKIIGSNLKDLFPNAQASSFHYACLQALQYQKTVSIEEYIEHFDRWFESSIYPSDNGLSVYVSDITEKVRADEELQQKNKQLQVLSSYLQNLREDERKKIARELHDDLGQIATVLKVDVVRIRKQYLDGQTDIEQKLTTLLNTMDILISKIRKISYELRPDLLDHVGLQTALEKHCKEFEKVTGTICIFNDETPENTRFTQELETTIFRICQEALTNIMRHAAASKVVVTISLLNNEIILTIKDNGKGFDIIAKKQSLGLLGMQERAKAIMGELEIISQINKGTTIQFSVNYVKSATYENINS